MASDILTSRLQNARMAAGEYKRLDADVVDEVVHLYKAVQLHDASKRIVRISPIRSWDAKDASLEEIQRWLSSLPVSGERILVVWVSEQVGIEVSLPSFIDRFEYLWSPAADDVCVVDNAIEWLLIVDHEEVLSLFQLER